MVDIEINLDDLANKLFCTFTTKEELDSTLDTIKDQYQILFNKIFVLYLLNLLMNTFVLIMLIPSICLNTILDNTILLHRKKDSNTLYTINALNDLIKSLNGGVIDTSFKVDWQDYKNCILLTTGGELKKLDTKVHDILTF